MKGDHGLTSYEEQIVYKLVHTEAVMSRQIKCRIVNTISQMRLFSVLLLIETCFANIYRVGENRTFSAFEIRRPIEKIITSSPPIKFGDCGPRDFCLQTFSASRGALINGVVTEPVFAVVFYLSQCTSPQALVVNKKGAPKQELNLPNGTVIHKSLDVEVGSTLYYLLLFNKDIEKFEVVGGKNLSSLMNIYVDPYNLTQLNRRNIVLITGYMNTTPMSVNLLLNCSSSNGMVSLTPMWSILFVGTAFGFLFT
ncbi:hypothetical protein SprV_0802523500 [Sparganum proliferum]